MAIGAFPNRACCRAAASASGMIVSHPSSPGPGAIPLRRAYPGGEHSECCPLRCPLGCRRSRVADETRRRPVVRDCMSHVCVTGNARGADFEHSAIAWACFADLADSLTRRRGWLVIWLAGWKYFITGFVDLGMYCTNFRRAVMLAPRRTTRTNRSNINGRSSPEPSSMPFSRMNDPWSRTR